MKVKSWYQRKFGWVPRPVRRAIVLVIGGTLLLLALVGMVLPIMPGIIFIPLALAILAAEFTWAARWLVKITKSAKGVQTRHRNSWYGQPTVAAEPVAPAAAKPADGAAAVGQPE